MGGEDISKLRGTWGERDISLIYKGRGEGERERNISKLRGTEVKCR